MFFYNELNEINEYLKKIFAIFFYKLNKYKHIEYKYSFLRFNLLNFQNISIRLNSLNSLFSIKNLKLNRVRYRRDDAE